MFMPKRVTAAIAGVAALALGLVGCSPSERDSTQGAKSAQSTAGTQSAQQSQAAEGNFPVTVASGVEGEGEEITLDEAPTKIVSLSPTSTEILFGIGAGEQVIAADEYSTYPTDAPKVDGLSGYNLNAESVIGYDPDLVVLSQDKPEFLEALKAVEIPVLVMPAAKTIDQVYDQIERLGAATGHVGDAVEVVANMQSDIDAAVASVPAEIREAGLTYYHEVSGDYYSVTDSTFLGNIYGLFGLKSIATGDKDYPQLSAEAIIDANPDLIFRANHKSENISVEDVAKRPGWDTIAAVKNGVIIDLDEDIASRWGTRVSQLVQMIAEELNAHAEALEKEAAAA